MSRSLLSSKGLVSLSTRIPKPAPALRKAPRQARSRATVGVLVEAAARVLAQRGWAGFTTNAVAQRAGVSIGSLYQYFSDKAALTAAVRSRHVQEVLAVMQGGVGARLTLEQRVRAIVHGLVIAHSGHPDLHRVLIDEVPGQALPLAHQDPVEAAYLGCFEALLVKHGRARAGLPAQQAALVLSDAVDGVIHNAARRGTLQQPELECALATLILDHLRAGRRRVA